MPKPTTIGFFGDSFCADFRNDHSIDNNYKTYIEKLSTSLDSEVVNTGIGGSSIWDSILLQFDEDNIPDICIFVWTEPYRWFHRKNRTLNPMSINSKTLKESDPGLNKALSIYMRHLYDEEKQKLESTSLLHYFDKKILSKYKNKKFIHLWCFSDSVYYRWDNGVEIRPALIELSVLNSNDVPQEDKRANHIEGEEKNSLLYNTIMEAINYYEDKKLITLNTQGINYD